MFKNILVALLAVVAFSGCSRIETGNVGVEKTMGQVKNTEMPAGVYFTLFKTVYEFDTKETSMQFDDLHPKAKENLTMQDFDFDIYYQINPNKVADLFIKYSGDVKQKEDGNWAIGQNLLNRLTREAAYSTIAEFSFANMQNQRVEVAATLQRKLQKEVDDKVGKDVFLITNVNIRSITTDKALEDSIRRAAQVEFQVREKNEQVKLARAEAERLQVEAEAQAKANTTISNSLTGQLVEVKRIEAMKGFSDNKNVTVFIGGAPTITSNVK